MKSSEDIGLYGSEYFLKSVDSYEYFQKFNGSFESLFERYQKNIQLLDLQPAHVYLKIGFGRGEVCTYHSLNGGSAKGVDYSQDAIALAQRKAIELGAMTTFCVSSFCELNAPNNTYDRILASEFIEHISLSEGEDFFGRAYAMLKPECELLVYTMPNTLQRKYGYPLARLCARARGLSLPEKQEDTISEHYLKYHLNEQSYFKLKKFAVSTGFKKFTVGYDWAPKNQSTLVRRIVWAIVRVTPRRHILLANLFLLTEK